MRPVPDVVQDYVEPNGPVDEIFRGVVDNMGGSERPHEVDVPSAAHSGDLGAERYRDLHGERPDPSAGADHQHPLPGLNVANIADRVQGGDGRHRQRRRLFERKARWLGHKEGRVGDGVLGEGSPAGAEDLIAALQTVHVRADGLDPARDVDARDPGLRPGQADAHQAGDARVAAQHVPVVRIDRGGVHLDKHFARTDLGYLSVDQVEGFGRAVALLRDRFHQNYLGANGFAGGNCVLLHNAHFDSLVIAVRGCRRISRRGTARWNAIRVQASTRRSRQAAKPIRTAA